MLSSRWRTPRLAGIGMAATANCLFAFNDAMLRLVADETGVAEAVWGRFFFFLVFGSLAILPFHWRAVADTGHKGALLLRGVIPVVGTYLVVLTIGYIPFAEAAAIIFLAPVATMILGLLLLGERVGLAPRVAALVGVAGMLAITRPWGGALHPAYLGAMGAMAAIACHQLLTRFAAVRVNPWAANFYMALAAAATSSLILPFVWVTPSPLAVAGMAASGLIYLGSHVLFIAAHRQVEASMLAPYSYFQLVGAMAFGYALLGQVPTAWTLAGAAAIALAGALIVAGELRGGSRPADRVAPTPDAAQD